MADSQSTIWVLEVDAEQVLASFEEIATAAEAMGEQVSQIADGSASLDVLNEILTAIQEQTQIVTAGFDDLNSSMTMLSGDIEAVTSAIEGLGTSLSSTATAEASVTVEAESTAESFSLMSTAAEAATGAMDALQSAQGPLTMIAMGAVMAGKSLFDMGTQGQKGEALLAGMAGASQADIQALQQEALKLGVSMDQASQGFYQVESAGYSGSQAITVYDAALKLAEGSQSEAGVTTQALTNIMHDYSAKASQATEYTDLMHMAVFRGQQSMQDFASAIGPLASAAENVGFDFKQVAAAEATMTMINPHVKQDTQQLTSLFNFLSPTMGGVSAAAKKLGLSFNEAHYSSLDLLGKLQYLADIAGGTNTAAFAKLTGGVKGSTAAIDLLKGGAGAFKDNLDAMGHAAGTTAKAFDTYENTVPAHMAKAGAAMSVFATKLMDAIGPKITPIIDKVTAAIGWMSDMIIHHTNAAIPVLAGLSAMIGTAIVGAIAAFLVTAAPVLAVLAGIGLAVTGVVYAYQNWNSIVQEANTFFKQHQVVVDLVIGAIVGIATALAVAFVPSMIAAAGAAVVGFGAWAVAAGAAAIASLAAAAPFILIGLVVAAVVVGILLAVQHWGEIAHWLQGVWGAFSGWFMGILGTIGAFFVGIWNGITSWFQGAWNGTISWFRGLWNGITSWIQGAIGAIGSAFQAAWNAIVNFFKSVWQGWVNIVHGGIATVVGWFEWLYNHNYYFKDLVDAIRSIITAIVSWLTSTWQTVANAVVGAWNWLKQEAQSVWQGLVNLIKTIVNAVATWLKGLWDDEVRGIQIIWNKLSGFAQTAWNAVLAAFHAVVDPLIAWLTGLWNDEITGIQILWNKLAGFATTAWNDVTSVFQDAWNGISSALSGLWNNISSWFTGIVSQATTWGSNIIQGFINGINSMLGAVGNAASNVAKKVASFLGFHSPTEEGPGAQADQWAPAFVTMFADGINNNVSRVKAAVSSIAHALSEGIQNPLSINANVQGGLTPQLPSSLTGGILGGGASNSILLQILAALQQQRGGSSTSNTIVNNQFSNQFSGVNNIQELFALFQSLAGLQIEQSSRGVF